MSAYERLLEDYDALQERYEALRQAVDLALDCDECYIAGEHRTLLERQDGDEA